MGICLKGDSISPFVVCQKAEFKLSLDNPLRLETLAGAV